MSNIKELKEKISRSKLKLSEVIEKERSLVSEEVVKESQKLDQSIVSFYNVQASNELYLAE
ncbi:Spo0E family sporulation regulatory protein-aspartic acid phosphatase [Natroniella sulfidigena]|uniref:Spo0E family sporulation regulatory protein-aspartic acid phosphatase n=1 Tax=Natroniella sulfidigena TaxID=723921 RepID=UPI00200A75BC|nr:Spo0E family sporulation regulatory protein-aspartic acid phosphatase [Natroniella sulfidigena]MCK8817895.1 Spo0E family sporulation regulatory protein-aspartic acid phosphatase [Natroniella sulfidigena]